METMAGYGADFIFDLGDTFINDQVDDFENQLWLEKPIIQILFQMNFILETNNQRNMWDNLKTTMHFNGETLCM